MHERLQNALVLDGLTGENDLQETKEKSQESSVQLHVHLHAERPKGDLGGRTAARVQEQRLDHAASSDSPPELGVYHLVADRLGGQDDLQETQHCQPSQGSLPRGGEGEAAPLVTKINSWS